MKALLKVSALFCSVLATLSLAAGLDQFAAKFDPVSQKSQAVSSLEDGAMPDLPCISCTIDPE